MTWCKEILTDQRALLSVALHMSDVYTGKGRSFIILKCFDVDIYLNLVTTGIDFGTINCFYRSITGRIFAKLCTM